MKVRRNGESLLGIKIIQIWSCQLSVSKSINNCSNAKSSVNKYVVTR